MGCVGGVRGCAGARVRVCAADELARVRTCVLVVAVEVRWGCLRCTCDQRTWNARSV